MITRSENPVAKRTALLLVRTPLQAWIAEQVLHAETVSHYDIVYFTHNDSSEDRYYFKRLAAQADHSQYCYAPKRHFDILGHLDFRRQANGWYRDKKRDLILFASIDSHVMNAISRRQAGSELITFDDGLGNILPSDRYYLDNIPWRSRIYRSLLGASDLASTKNRIVRHYTIYPRFDNIIDRGRLQSVKGWIREKPVAMEGAIKTYFLGQPFEEAMSAEDIKILENYLSALSIDYYVRHPRENNPLALGVPFLDKEGRIAEEAILRSAGSCPVHVIGWFSSALFNLGEIAQRRSMFLLGSDPGTPRMAEMAQKAGCEIVIL